MVESTYIAALAGLLHDIGKFALRAGEGGTRTWDNLAAADFGYKHALLTADFIDQYVPEPWRVPVKNAAGNHHRPVARTDRIVALADRLSAGERADLAEDDKIVQPKQLLSIFCSVEADEQTAPERQFWPLETLRLEEDVLFPAGPLADDESARRYRALWDGFTSEAKILAAAHAAGDDLPIYLEQMAMTLQRYTWCIPAAYYGSDPDISLYDHDRMTAALAAVLEGSDLDESRLQQLGRQANQSDEPLALLVGGDISGVQDFIYTISSRGAASALRGRSFYLQLLAEAALRTVLEGLDLPATNVVYSAGGHFYLLARPTDQARLAEIQRDISRILLAHHGGDLYLALAALPLCGRDFFEGRISRAWAELAQRLSQAKLRRFSELGAEVGGLFEPQGHGGNEDQQCQVCGAEHPDTKQQRRGVDTEGVRKCPPCASYEALGQALRDAEYLVWTATSRANTAHGSPGTWEEVLAALGWRAEVAPAGRLPGANGRRRTILALSDRALANSAPLADAHTAIGRRLLVNVTPVARPADLKLLADARLEPDEMPDPGDILSFGALEALAHGVPRLGVLRMDVDNLGKLFAEGLGNRSTLSRVAALSSAVSLYFEGWVEVLAARRNRDDAARGQGMRLYSIYSGGDDLFFVGAWDAVAELAREIRRDLGRFAAGHPGIHASAGIVLVGGKYPLYQAARDAAEAEDAAKRLQWMKGREPHRKDGVCFLGQTLPWERFGLEPCDQPGMDSAHALMHLLVSMQENNGGGGRTPQALIRRLVGLQQRYDEAATERRLQGRDQNRSGEDQVLWGPWMWLAVYTLSRMADQTKNAEIRALRDRLKKDNFRSMPWIGLAARWAELWLR